VVKRAGKCTCRPDRVVWVAVGGGGVAAGVVLTGEFRVGLPWPDSSNTYAVTYCYSFYVKLLVCCEL
jgi:hypothetical protein